MESIYAKGQKINFLLFFIISVIFLWIKTYLAQWNEFNLGIDNSLQRFLLLLNPLGSAILFLGLSLLTKGINRYISLLVIHFILSFILFGNILYYRFFNDFLTLPTFTQTQNIGDVSGNIVALLKPHDILYFLDTFILLALIILRVVKLDFIEIQRFKLITIFTSAFILMGANLALAEMDRPQLLTRTFDRNYIVKYLGMYNYMIYDAVQSTRSSAQRVMADSNDITEVINYTKSNYASPNPKYFGLAKGMNVIYIHLESLQNFIINYNLNGSEVTPFLNSLTKDSSTLYFNNFFHQTAQGKSSDAEFMLENSLFGLPQGSAYSTKGLNTYQAAPAILGHQGYTSGVFHGNSGSFWNRNEIYKSFGYDKFFDSSYYKMDTRNVLNYGLKDKPFFEQSIPMLEALPQPFYTKFITLSNHFPYLIDEEDATIPSNNTGDATVDRYFQTARYLDESVEQIFNYLKESELYNNSVIILYGDHYGNSANRNEAMSKVIGKEITPFEYAGLQRVPLFIRVPGIEGGNMSQYGGQIDVLPTLLHLLGIDSNKYIQFGTDLLSLEHKQLVPFRNGDFMSPSVNSIDGDYFDSNGNKIGKNEEITRYEELVKIKLNFSDRVVNGDLLRFYKPEGFIPVDRSIYKYNQSN
ncbi:LTA synthase family protein [Metabacillus halosaccharovorans]|uniref:LTA synthase family protein n=1 Tax=Metabacillus halosaccharovorans TaxID=930124 RepID=UPI001C1F6821|nr:LTA synthase family protein [Metabacillus halosaccharovorans]